VATLSRTDAVELLARMCRLARANAPKTEEAAEAFGAGWRDFVASRTPSTTVTDIEVGLEPHGELMWELLSNATLDVLARSLATQFMLLTPLSVDQLAKRRTLTLGFNEDYRRPAEQWWARRFRASVGEALGWKACLYEIEVPAVGRAERYQAEIPAPSGLQVVFAELRCWPRRDEPGGDAQTGDPVHNDRIAPLPRALLAAWRALKDAQEPSTSSEYRAPVPRALSAAWGAVRHPRQPPAALLRRIVPMSDAAVALQFEDHDIPGGSSGLVLVGFQTCRAGLVLIAPFLSALITTLLFVGRGRLNALATHDEAAGPLLLALPTLLAAFVARPIDHSLTARLLIGPRILVATAGLTTFVAAASLTAHWDQHTLYVIWGWAAWTATLVTGLLVSVLALGARRSWRAGHAKAREVTS
jgi:hypothetical protein